MKLINNFSKAILLLFSMVALPVSVSMAQRVSGVYAYPEKGQSKDQQAQDESSCYSWAEGESINNPTPQETPRQHKQLKRTAGGAGVGALIGGGKGAAIGAGIGAISGTRSKRRDEKQSAAMASDDFVRAYSSCLRGKGYSVE